MLSYASTSNGNPQRPHKPSCPHDERRLRTMHQASLPKKSCCMPKVQQGRSACCFLLLRLNSLEHQITRARNSRPNLTCEQSAKELACVGFTHHQQKNHRIRNDAGFVPESHQECFLEPSRNRINISAKTEKCSIIK